MPGFLSLYDGTEKIDLGGGYWCEVKKCLSRQEYAAVENLMGARQRVDVGAGRQFASLDISGARFELVTRSLVAWNLDDEQGHAWPLEPEQARRAAVAKLPQSVFEQIYRVCDELNGQDDPAERRRFPGQPELSDPDGDGGPADPPAVPDGEGTVAAAWPEAGDTAGAPPAP